MTENYYPVTWVGRGICEVAAVTGSDGNVGITVAEDGEVDDEDEDDDDGSDDKADVDVEVAAEEAASGDDSLYTNSEGYCDLHNDLVVVIMI